VFIGGTAGQGFQLQDQPQQGGGHSVPGDQGQNPRKLRLLWMGEVLETEDERVLLKMVMKMRDEKAASPGHQKSRESRESF
jgi:hypothetical protein